MTKFGSEALKGYDERYGLRPMLMYNALSGQCF
jgi:hypothetical protein